MDKLAITRRLCYVVAVLSAKAWRGARRASGSSRTSPERSRTTTGAAFCQRRGMRIVGVSPGAVDAARALKPSIPVIGGYGIELHDELTLELAVTP